MSEQQNPLERAVDLFVFAPDRGGDVRQGHRADVPEDVRVAGPDRARVTKEVAARPRQPVPHGREVRGQVRRSRREAASRGASSTARAGSGRGDVLRVDRRAVAGERTQRPRRRRRPRRRPPAKVTKVDAHGATTVQRATNGAAVDRATANGTNGKAARPARGAGARHPGVRPALRIAGRRTARRAHPGELDAVRELRAGAPRPQHDPRQDHPADQLTVEAARPADGRRTWAAVHRPGGRAARGAGADARRQPSGRAPRRTRTRSRRRSARCSSGTTCACSSARSTT